MSFPASDPVVSSAREEAILREMSQELARLSLPERIELHRDGALVKHVLARACVSWPEYKSLLREVAPGGASVLESMLDYVDLTRPGASLGLSTIEEETEEEVEDEKAVSDSEEPEEEEEEEKCDVALKSGARKGEACGRSVPCSVHRPKAKAKAKPKPKTKAQTKAQKEESERVEEERKAVLVDRMTRLGKAKSAPAKTFKAKPSSRKTE